MTLATRRKSTITFTSVGRRRPLRIGPALVRSIAGMATQGGTVRCGSSAVRNCATRQVRFRNAYVRLLSPRRGFARFARTQGLAAVRRLSTECPEEPVDIRLLRTDLDIADAPLDAADVFDRQVTRFFISGNTTQQTSVSGEYEGSATERVRWTLMFTRVR
jgi:hypothetical protein